MTVLFSISKTLTAGGNSGGPSTWGSMTFPTFGSSVGFTGSTTIELYPIKITIHRTNDIKYFPRPTSKTNYNTKTIDTRAIDLKLLTTKFIIEGWLSDATSNAALEQMYKLLAISEQGGAITMVYRGVTYTQVVIDTINIEDIYAELKSQTSDTTYYMDSDSSNTNPEQGKLKYTINLTIARPRGG